MSAPVPIAGARLRRSWPGAAVVRSGVSGTLVALALVLVAATVANEGTGSTVADGLRATLAIAFAVAGWLLTRSPATARTGLLVLAGVVVAAAEFAAATALRNGDGGAGLRAFHGAAATLVLATAFHVLVALPDGRLGRRSLRLLVGAVYVAAGVAASAARSGGDTPSAWPLVATAAVLGAGGLLLSNRRYAAAGGMARRRMQWVGLSLAMVVEVALVTGTLHLLLGWPPRPAEVVAASLVLVAAGLAASGSPRMTVGVDRLLAHAVAVTGLTAVVIGASLFVVVGLRRVPTVEERPILTLSICAAALCTLLYAPARARLTVLANRLVFGQSNDPTEALTTFGTRMTRALPMDELLLQLAELCKRHYGLRSAEVWTGTGGRLVRTAAVPDAGPGRLDLGEEELAVVTRAGLCGRAWAAVWLPRLLQDHGEGPLRIAPMTHSGELFGLLVLERAEGRGDFSEEDGRVLTELARQVGLALQNSELDSALKATLEEVRRKNVELAESRARIVASGDAERRRIERNLHDGAQQHLVALAVKLRLVHRLGESDPAAALALVEEARNDALATVEELRALAHGIYPPLLMDRGLPDALAAAAGRAAIPTTVEVAGELGRFPQEVEAAVYFCCLEALQNAAKHGGEGATARVVVQRLDGEVRFSVSDDGAGFDPGSQAKGQGFVSMGDRLAAIGGGLDVRSRPGEGTTIEGRIPLAGPTDAPEGFGPPT